MDPRVIPGRAQVYIESQDGHRVVGNRFADDTGGGIHGYRVQQKAVLVEQGRCVAGNDYLRAPGGGKWRW